MSEEENESKVGVALAVGCGILILLVGGGMAVLFFSAGTMNDAALQRADEAMEQRMLAEEAAAAARAKAAAAQAEAEAAAESPPDEENEEVPAPEESEGD